MIKRILVPLDPSVYTEKSTHTAIELAARNDAEIGGLVVFDPWDIKESVGPAPMGAFYYQERARLERAEAASKELDDVLNRFRERCLRANVRHREVKQEGVPNRKILSEAAYYDLTVMGLKTHFHYEPEDRPGKYIESLLHFTVNPVLGIPADWHVEQTHSEKLRVLICYDGSPLSARALHSFVQLMPFISPRIVLLNVGKVQTESRAMLNEAELFMNAHGLTDIEKQTASGEVLDIVRDDFLDKIDAVVVGAHAKKPLFDFAFGSLARLLIHADRVPVFIGH